MTPCRRIGSRKQLFIDRYLIAEERGIERRMHPARKHPQNPLLKPEHAWEGMYATASNSLVYDREAGQYRLWYQVRNYASPYRSCYATSTDGLIWERPDLELVEYNGSRRNNLLPETAGQVLYCPEELEPGGNPQKLYKGISWREELGQHTRYSRDGLHWTVGEKVTLEGMGDVFVVGSSAHRLPDRTLIREEERQTLHHGEMLFEGRPIENRPFPPPFYGFLREVRIVRGRENVRVLSMTYSENFSAWTRPAMILVPDYRDDEMAEARLAEAAEILEADNPLDHHCQFYTMYVFPYGDLFLGMLLVFDESCDMRRLNYYQWDGIFHMQLAASRDLYNWERLGDRAPFIPRGPNRSWDGGLVSYPCLPIAVGDELRIYYTGVSITHGGVFHSGYRTRLINAYRAGTSPPFSSIGLATLRLDGFVSARADGDGEITTLPLEFEGDRLQLNVDAGAGSARVEVLDEEGRLIPGFSGEDAAPITLDSTAHPVSWRSNPTLARLKGQRIRLRFQLRNADLYAFQFV